MDPTDTGKHTVNPTLLAADAVVVDRINALGGIDLVSARFLTRATPVHSHAEVEVGVVEGGERLVHCRGRRTRVGPGTVMIFAPGELHAGAPANDGGSGYRAFLVPVATLNARTGWGGDVGDPPWFPESQVRDTGLAAELTDLHRRATTGESNGLDDALAAALSTLCHRYRRPSPRAGGAGEHAAVIRVRDYLETNFASKIRLETLSEVGGLSVFHLIRVFRAATGLPPYRYLEQVRINRATALLRQGQTVSRVAEQTGFADQSHLTRFFKRLVGVPPGRYRRSVLSAEGRA